MKKGELTNLIEQLTYDEAPRDYIGASSIGSDCLRQIWYQFKGIKSENISNKLARTWNIGKKIEGLVLDYLESAGLK